MADVYSRGSQLGLSLPLRLFIDIFETRKELVEHLPFHNDAS